MFRNLWKLAKSKWVDFIDASLYSDYKSLLRKFEKLNATLESARATHRKEILSKETEIEILESKIRVQDETIKLQKITIEGEYERRKSEIAAHMRNQIEAAAGTEQV